MKDEDKTREQLVAELAELCQRIAELDLLEGKTSLRLTDEQLRQHPAWQKLPEEHVPLRGLLGTRLVRRDGQTNGLIMVSDKEKGDFTAEDEALLTQLAALASLGLQHIEARNEAERRAEELETGRARLKAIIENAPEGVVVADEAGRILLTNPAADDIYARSVPYGEDFESHAALDLCHLDGTPLRQLTRGALAEMRTLLLELQPRALVDAELGDLLQQLIEAFAARTPVEGQRSLPPEVQIALYRMAQEALNNVTEHAQATQVAVSLRRQPEEVDLRIRDNGGGFDPDRARPGRLGLNILRERAEAIGATLQLTSRASQGTEIAVTWSDAQQRERKAND